MFGKHKIQALVVGAGPVGQFAALALARLGVDVEIIDSDWRTAKRSYALALHPGTLRLLDEYGLAQPLIRQGRQVDKMCFYDRNACQAEIHLHELDGVFPFIQVLPQSALEDALEEALLRHGVKIHWNHRCAGLDSQGGRTVAEIHRMEKVSCGYSAAVMETAVTKVFHTEASYVIGADGFDSLIRRKLGLEFPQRGRPQMFSIFEFDTDVHPESEARVVLDDQTTNVLWPMSGERCRWSFEISADQFEGHSRVKDRNIVGDWTSVGQEDRGEIQSRFHNLAQRRAPWFTSAPREIYWTTTIKFEPRLASAFGRGNIWLVGDAAHQSGPVGVQGMNVGMREADDLARRIARILNQGGPGSLLDDYGARHAAEWIGLLGFDGVLSCEDASQWVQTRAARIPACVPASGDDLTRLLAQVGIEMSSPVGASIP